MLGGRVMIGNSIAGAELPKGWRIKLSSVVVDQYPWYADPVEDVLAHKALYLLLNYGYQGLVLCLLGEVVYYDNSKLNLTLCHWERSDYVNALLSEWPRAEN